MKISLYPKYLIRSLFIHGKHDFFKDGYKLLYPEYRRHGMTPWQHYVIDGKRKGFGNGTCPSDNVFFGEGYELEYPDVKAAGVDPWHHYVENGLAEGRDNGLHPIAKLFFAHGYLEMYPDVADVEIEPWHHYVLTGKKAGLDNGWHPNKEKFFPDGYLEMYPEIAETGIDPWEHYVSYGKSEGKNNGLNDYNIVLFGCENDPIKSVYLTPHKSSDADIKNTKKALLIGHEFSLTGAPLSLLGIAKILISDGYAVDVAVRDSGHSVPTHLYDGIGADVFLLPQSTECFTNADAIIKNYDLVIINTIVMGAYAELCRKQNIPHIWFIREDLPMIHHFFRTIAGSEQNFFEDSQNVVCVSKYVTDCIYSEYKIKYKYINNFIDDRFQYNDSIKRKNPDSNKGIVTFAVVCGTVERRKAQETVIAAFMYLSANPRYKGKWKVYFIGKYGSDASDPSWGVKLLSVTKNIKDIVWFGQVNDGKWELFNKIDFFIVPSLEEASSRVAIEAAMLGKPVIVSTHVGAKYLTEKNAGFIFEPGNSAELRNIVIRCLEMSDDEYGMYSRQIRVNYEKTSSRFIYVKSLSAVINEATDRCSHLRLLAGPHVSLPTLRAMSSGRNVNSFGNIEYIKYVDFTPISTENNKSATKTSKYPPVSGVIIPVFNGVDHLKVLIPSLFRNTDLPHRFVFVDDCSNSETSDFLRDSIRGRDDCILVMNEQNLGFVKSINKGATKALESCDNFVMLNSDTEVPSGWLSRLMKPIFEDEKISSVTPLSNRCNIFSFPFFDKRERNDIFIKEFGLDGINNAILKSSVNGVIEIPTGHGFCMAISGIAWKKVGGLNEALFGRGFGEENEWSLRAELDGFRNVLIPDLYVAHHEKGSFSSEEKMANCAAAQDIISVMFPLYGTRIQNFLREYPLSDSIISIYISLAKQKGYDAETFVDPSKFMTRISKDDGIFVLKTNVVTKIAVKLLGETILVENAKNLDKSGIYNS